MNSLTVFYSFLIFACILGMVTLQEKRKQQNQRKDKVLLIFYWKIELQDRVVDDWVLLLWG